MKGNKGSQGQISTVGTSLPPCGGARSSALASTAIGASTARPPAGYLTKNSLLSGVPFSGGTWSIQQKSSSSGGFSFRGAFTTQQKSYTSAHHNGTTYGRSLGGPYPSSSAFGLKRSNSHHGGFTYVPTNKDLLMYLPIIILHFRFEFFIMTPPTTLRRVFLEAHLPSQPLRKMMTV